MWSKTMVYSKTSTPEGRTELSIGTEKITVDVDHAALDDEELRTRYQRLDEFQDNARSLQLLKHKLAFCVLIFLPLLALTTAPSVLSSVGITGSSEGLFAQVVWTGSLLLSAVAFLTACVLIIIRSYYRYSVLSRLDSEITDAADELRQRGNDPVDIIDQHGLSKR